MDNMKMFSLYTLCTRLALSGQVINIAKAQIHKMGQNGIKA